MFEYLHYPSKIIRPPTTTNSMMKPSRCVEGSGFVFCAYVILDTNAKAIQAILNKICFLIVLINDFYFKFNSLANNYLIMVLRFMRQISFNLQ